VLDSSSLFIDAFVLDRLLSYYRQPAFESNDVLPTVLEVLVQTRIMPLDAFASVYGDVSASKFYFPTFKSYATPVAPQERADMAPFDAEELHVARDVVDELLQKLVHHRSIADAYCDVTEDPVPYFCQIKAQSSGSAEDELLTALGIAKDDDDRVHAAVEQLADQPPEAAVSLPEVATERDLQDGELQCLVEEVVEGLLFGMLTDGAPEAPLRQALLASRARSRGKAPNRSVVVEVPTEEA